MKIDKTKVLETIMKLREDMLGNPIAQATRVIHQEEIQGTEYIYTMTIECPSLMPRQEGEK